MHDERQTRVSTPGAAARAAPVSMRRSSRSEVMMTASDPPLSSSGNEAQARGRLLLELDPKKIRATRFKNRDDRSLLLHDPQFIQLTKSIAAHGQETPIRVRPLQDAQPFEFEIVSGHRRHAACLALDASTNKGFSILAIVDAAAEGTRELVLKMYRENADREDLSPYETGGMFKQWLDAEVFPTQEAISVATGQSKQNVGRYLALAALPECILAAFRDPRRLSLRWSSQLAGAAASGGPGLEALAEELANRDPEPAAEAVFAELVGSVPRRKSRGKRAESIKDGKRVLFQFSARDGRYGIRLGQQIDAQLRRQLQQDLKEWLRAWLKERAPGQPEQPSTGR
jgi:ParB family transcriptional regulator, chromosome partitioning protein